MTATGVGGWSRLARIALIAAVAAGCGSSSPSGGAPATIDQPAAASSTASEPAAATESTVAPGTSAFDGVVSAEEGAAATDLVLANPIAQALIAAHGATLSQWQPADLEGEQRGAHAVMNFAAPATIEPRVIRPDTQLLQELASADDQTENVDLSVDDYVLHEEVWLSEVVSRYAVAVDLATMRIVSLTTMPNPPTTTG